MDKPYILTQLYKKQYRQRKNNKQKDFYIQLDEKVVWNILIIEKRISYIKGALIITLKDLEEGLTDQRSNKRIIIPINKGLTFRSLRQRFKLKEKDELRVNLKHLAYYILVQIIYINNECNIYKALKVKNKKYLVRIYQTRDKRKYRNTKYIYRWHLVDNIELNKLILQPGRYLTEEYLEGRQQWECLENIYLQYIEDKKQTRYQLMSKLNIIGLS